VNGGRFYTVAGRWDWWGERACDRQHCQRPPALPFGQPAVGYLAPLGSTFNITRRGSRWWVAACSTPLNIQHPTSKWRHPPAASLADGEGLMRLRLTLPLGRAALRYVCLAALGSNQGSHPSLRLRRSGGWGGIRTLVGFKTQHAFQACAFDHSATHPFARGGILRGNRRRASVELRER
jgi:hypothetical protein